MNKDNQEATALSSTGANEEPSRQVDAMPFNLNDVEDVRIIVVAKNKHWTIIPADGFDREKAKDLRKLILNAVLQCHSIVDTALEDILKLKKA